jgi:hypothetical protein
LFEWGKEIGSSLAGKLKLGCGKGLSGVEMFASELAIFLLVCVTSEELLP